MSNQSWKIYGGINKTEKMNYITTKSIVANNLSTKEAYVGNYDICGELHVSNNTILSQNATIDRDLLVGGNTRVFSGLTVSGNTTLNSDTRINGNVHIKNRLDVSKNAIIEGSMNVYDKLYIGQNSSQYLYGSTSGIGLNTILPQSTLDIYGTNTSSLNVKSSSLTNTNILARNTNNHGIVLSVDDLNGASSSIQFYNDRTISNTPDAQIIYTAGGQLLIDTAESTNIRSHMAVSYRPFDTSYPPTPYLNETVTIYDISSGQYLPNYYGQTGAYNSGNALTLVSDNSNSNTFLNIITPNKMGMAVGGGAFPVDINRSVGVIGLVDISGNMSPVQTIVSGNIDVLQRATIGINKYNPITEKYVLDINGPVHIDNGDITNVYKQSYIMTDVANSDTLSVSVGLNNINYSNNGGKTWHRYMIAPIESVDISLNTASVYDSNYAIVGAIGGYIFYTSNGGQDWNRITTGISKDVKSIHMYKNTSSNQVGYYITYSNYNSNSYYNVSDINVSGPSPNPLTLTGIHTINSISGLQGSNLYTCFAGSIIDGSGCISISGTDPIYITNLTTRFNSIKTKLDGLTYITIAVGNGIISSSIVTDSTTIVSNFQNYTSNLSGVTFNDVYIYNKSCAVAVGNGAVFYYTYDGAITWAPVPVQLLNSSGIAANTLRNASNNFIGIYMNTIDSFVITSVGQDGTSNIYYCYLPNLFNSKNNSVLDLCGNMGITGDLTVDNVYIKTNLEVFCDSSLNGRLTVGLDVSLNSNLWVGNTVSIRGNLFVNNDVSMNSNLVVGNAVTVQGKLNVLKDSSFNGKLFVSRDVSMNANLFVLGNTNVQGNLIVLNDSSFNGRLFVLQDVSLNANLFVSDTVTVQGNLIVLKDSSFNGKLFVLQDVSLNANLFVSDTVTVQGNLIVLNDSSFNGRLFVLNDVSLNANLNVLGNTTVQGNLIILKDSSFNGKLFVLQDVSMNANLYVLGNTTVQGNLIVLTDTSFNGRLFVSQDVSMNANLNVLGNTTVQGNMIVLNDTSFNGKLFVSNDVSLNSNLIVSGNTTISGNLTVSNNVTLNSNLSVGKIINVGNITNLGESLTINSMNTNITGNTIKILGSSVPDKTTITIGKSNDDIYIPASITIYGITTFQGNVVTTGSSTTSDTKLQLNSGSQASSSGGGIQIGDFGVDDANYIQVSTDKTGYNLKTATSNSNILKVDISKLNAVNKIVTLSTPTVDATYTTYPMVSSTVDIDNILLRKGTLSTSTLQQISTDLTILGNTISTGYITNKPSGINSNMVMDINGNVTISRLGINQTAINNTAVLDVGGNIAVSGNIVASQYIIQYTGFIQQF